MTGDAEALCLCGHGYSMHAYPIGKKRESTFMPCWQGRDGRQCGCGGWQLWDQESLRDRFAGDALAAMARDIVRIVKVGGGGETDADVAERTARSAYVLADAMLRERARTPEPGKGEAPK